MTLSTRLTHCEELTGEYGSLTAVKKRNKEGCLGANIKSIRSSVILRTCGYTLTLFLQIFKLTTTSFVMKYTYFGVLIWSLLVAGQSISTHPLSIV